MSSKVPPRQPPPSRRPVTATAGSSTGSIRATAPSNARPVSETLRKRRMGIWAVGVAIIVGAGAIAGGELRERQKAKERIAAQAAGQVGVTHSGTEVESELGLKDVTEKAVTVPATTQSSGQAVFGATQQANPVASNITIADARGKSYDQQQLAYLEDRRAVLLRQKLDVEQKLVRVREKKKREEEMEGRRGAEIRGTSR